MLSKGENHHWLHRIQVGLRQKMISNPHLKSSTRILSLITSELMDKQQVPLEQLLIPINQQPNKTS
jgi:hypothetical protein